jgi:hypothetical protein
MDIPISLILPPASNCLLLLEHTAEHLGDGIRLGRRLSSLADLLLSTLHCQGKPPTTGSSMQFHFLVLSLFATHVTSQERVPMLRFECSQLVVERLDPLVNPGSAPSPHLHQIVGGNSFRSPIVPAAPFQRTFPTTGRRFCTSALVMEHLNAYLRSSARVSLASAGLQCTIFQRPAIRHSLPRLDQDFVCLQETQQEYRQARRARCAIDVCQCRETTVTLIALLPMARRFQRQCVPVVYGPSSRFRLAGTV